MLSIFSILWTSLNDQLAQGNNFPAVAGLGNTRVSLVRFSLDFLEQTIIMNQCSVHYSRWHFGHICLLILFCSADWLGQRLPFVFVFIGVNSFAWSEEEGRWYLKFCNSFLQNYLLAWTMWHWLFYNILEFFVSWLKLKQKSSFFCRVCTLKTYIDSWNINGNDIHSILEKEQTKW